MATSRTLGSSSNENYGNNGNGGSISRSRQRDREAKTLYDYLGASPKDTQEQLKIRYTTLVRTLHPDSNPSLDTQNSYYNLSDINAAWEVLKDPLERKKYDRSLQAKEIAEGIESFVSMGIQAFETTAIPWMKKTADTTVAAVDASTKKAQEVNEQARSAYGVFELEQQSKVLEQKANTEAARASKLEKELGALSTKTISGLDKRSQQQQQESQLSSAEAQRIFRSFQDADATAAASSAAAKPPRVLSKDMGLFVDTERKQRDAAKACLSTERATQQAGRRVEQALRAEEVALQRLEEAQKAFDDARRSYSAAMDAEKDAQNEERLAFQASTKIETALDRIREKVRAGLLQQHDLFLFRKSKELRAEIADCERSSQMYRDEARALRRKARERARDD